jgi:hypothetical protein
MIRTDVLGVFSTFFLLLQMISTIISLVAGAIFRPCFTHHMIKLIIKVVRLNNEH